MVRIPRFELHIRPMFRLIDREHMEGFGPDQDMDLWDYDSVVKYSQVIQEKLEIDNMPPVSSGGPWPKEWVDLFKRWICASYPRLELAAGTYEASRNGSEVELIARGNVPEGYRVWFDIKSIGKNRREYIIYAEPPSDPMSNDLVPFFAVEEFIASASLTNIVVNDSNGIQQVPIR